MTQNFDVRFLFFAFALAAAIFAFYTYYHKTVLGKLVRALLESGAESPETAKTFSELDIPPSATLARALRPTGALSGVVTVYGTPPTEQTLSARDDDALLTLHLYVAPEQRDKARGIYATEARIFVPIAITAAAAVLALCLNLLFPALAAWLGFSV